MGGSSSPSKQTVTQKSEPWSGAQPGLLNVYGQLNTLLGQTPEFYPGQTYASMSPYTQQGVGSALGFADNMFPQIYNQGMGTVNQLANSMDIANNPYVQGANQQAAQAMGNQANRNIGDASMALGNNLQNFGIASNYALGNLQNTLGGALGQFGLQANQAIGDYGMANQFGAQDYTMAGQQAAGAAGRTLSDMLGRSTLANNIAANQYRNEANIGAGLYQNSMNNVLGDTRNLLGTMKLDFNDALGDVTRALNNEWLPNVRSGAGLAGQYGGSRQGIAEGLAIGQAGESIEDMRRAQLNSVNNAWSNIGNIGSSGALGLSNLMGTNQTNLSNLMSSNALAQGQAQGNTAAELNNMISNLGRNASQNYMAGSRNTANTLQGLGNNYSSLAGTNALATSNALTGLGRDYTQAYGAGAQSMGNAIEQSQDAMGNYMSQTNLGAYGQGLNAAQNAAQMYPEYANLGLMPSQIYQQAGNIQQGYDQQGIDEAMARWDFSQNAQMQQLANANAILMGASPYATQATTTRGGSTSNPLATVAGLGLGAYGLYRGL